MSREKFWMLWTWLLIFMFTAPITLAISPILALLLVLPIKIGHTYRIGFETLFTNQRSGGTPSGYTPFQWWIRNPMHDWTSYVVGLEARNFKSIKVVGPSEVTLKSDIKQNGWIVALRRWGFLVLPFVSYSRFRAEGLYQFYWGWRPHGSFGIKARVKHLWFLCT